MRHTIILIASLILFNCMAQKQAVLPSIGQNDESTQIYRLQAGDKIELIVMQRRELSGEYQIGPDGTLALPLAGNIELKNLTRQQAEEKVKSALKQYYSPLSLMLKLLTFQSSEFYVIIGEVKKPGVFPVTNNTSLVKAIGNAAGFTDDAEISNIKLIRNGSEKQVVLINMHDIVNKGDFSRDYYLQKDDIIFIPRKKLANWLYPIEQVLPIIQAGLLVLITVNQLN